MSNKPAKGNSGNTNGGTETSFTNTPQAKDDAFGTPQSGVLDYVGTTYYLDVMANDLGGNSKSLWSVDDGINDSGAMSGYEAGDLLTQDEAGVTGVASNRSKFGAALSVTADGKVAYDVSTIDTAYATQLTGLALGETMSDSFIYAIRLASGTLSWGKANVVLTGVNDTPTVANVTLAAIEDNGAVTGNFAGDDVDSDNDVSDLTYTISGSAAPGSLTINGPTFTFDPGTAYQELAAGQDLDIALTYTATDRHGAESDPANLTITVTGVNDAPVITGGDASGSVTGKPPVVPFTVQQYLGYTSTNLSDLQNYAANNAANYTVTTGVIDYTDDPSGFAGLIPGSNPWPASQATGTSGTSASINNNFFARITGQLQVDVADTYTFRTFNDDGVFVKVGNTLVISDSGIHPEQQFTGSIALTPGVYPIEVFFFEFGGEASLEFSYRSSTGNYGLVNLDPYLRDTGTVAFSDVDLTDSHTVSAADIGSNLGTLAASKTADTTGTGTGGQIKWDYSVDNDAVRYLGEGDTKVESFTVTVDDGKGGTDTQQVDVTITGINDPAVLGNAVVNLTETDAVLSTGGTLTISDVDQGEAQFNTQTNKAGTNGTFNIDATGAWTYTTNSALDSLNAGQVVTDIFNVTSVDGTTTTVTVSVTGTPDGPTAVNDSNSLSASSPAQNTGNTVYWVDWQSITPIGNAFGEVKIAGTITLPDRTIGVTYTGQIYANQTYISPSNTLNYWDSYNGSQWLQGGDGVYTSSQVANGPGNTNFDFIALALADTPRNLSFSEPVANLFFAVASMNNNGYLFDQPFTVVSSAEAANDRGEWGYTSGITLSENNGQYGISTAGYSPNEFHGVLAINNAVDSLTWVSQSVEYWQGFTVGTYGVAQSATVSGNVLSNDAADTSAPVIEVSAAGGQTMVGNSVTLNLASGAILRVDRDGDYLYNDNGKFASLAAGQSAVETVQYTVKDNQGNTDTATLSITVNGVNDAPVAEDDSFSMNEDTVLTLNAGQLLDNDTDVDSGDGKFLVSVQDAINGVVALNNGVVTFTPNVNFSGSAGFSYTMRDATGLTSIASVDVAVSPVGDTFVLSNLVSNGSFENSTSGWSTSEINYIGDWQAADGSKTLDLNAEHGGGYVEQVLATTPGTTYTVGFAVSKNPGAPTGTETLRVSAAGSSQDFVFNQANTTTNMLWQEHKFSFIANSNSTALRLASADATGGTDAWGPALDEVVAFENRTIAFDKVLGDILDLSGVMDSINANPGQEFSAGFVQFQSVGANTVVSVDADGGGDNYIAIATLVGVNLLQSDTANYIL